MLNPGLLRWLCIAAPLTRLDIIGALTEYDSCLTPAPHFYRSNLTGHVEVIRIASVQDHRAFAEGMEALAAVLPQVFGG